MFRNKNKFITFLLLAALNFAVVSTGGEFLHSKIHHHNNQASHDACPVYQLQIQSLTIVVALAIALFASFETHAANARTVFISHFCFNLPPLRGPPASL